MARQVFFDPFGSYTQGFNVGANQQQNLESNVRRARAQDYDFNVVQPLRTRALQREDTVGSAAVPFRIKMLPIGLENAETNLYKNRYGAARQGVEDFGIAAPLESEFLHHYGFHTAQTPQGTQYLLPDQYGNYTPVQTVPNPSQQLLNNIYFPRNMQTRQYEDTQGYRQAVLDYQNNLARARELSAQANYYRATHPGGGYGFGVDDFIGGPSAPATQAPANAPAGYLPAPASSYAPQYNPLLEYGVQ